MTYLCLHTATETYKVKQRNWSEMHFHVNKDKTKTMRNNCQTVDPVKLGVEDVTEFTYLGAKVMETQRLKSRQGSTRQGEHLRL